MNLPIRPEDTPEPRRRNLNVNRARFSTDEPEEIVIEEATTPDHWYHNRGMLAVVIIVSLLVLWGFLWSYPTLRGFAAILGLFWLFAIGIHPAHAAARTIGSWFDNDGDN